MSNETEATTTPEPNSCRVVTVPELWGIGRDEPLGEMFLDREEAEEHYKRQAGHFPSSYRHGGWALLRVVTAPLPEKKTPITREYFETGLELRDNWEKEDRSEEGYMVYFHLHNEISVAFCLDSGIGENSGQVNVEDENGEIVILKNINTVEKLEALVALLGGEA
jgi:hypothetical protein